VIDGGGPTAAQIIVCFNRLYEHSEGTVLRGGADEPEYLPGLDGAPAQILFRADYAASALHEVAHWCIAGRRRRQLRDYGYWYQPDGRDAQQQARFMVVEARPQALECLFSAACGLPFLPSLDNLDAPPSADENRAFASLIDAACLRYRQRGLPPRAARFRRALERMTFAVDAPRDSSAA
jgi:elongation factor P hydroxylase